jgi:PPP family 3-phenylpropionic acid transporter
VRLACVGSAIRWAVIGFTHDPIVLIAVQSLHALTFGAFYLASVAIVDDECDPSARATAQGTWAAWSFGVAASMGLAIAGVVERASGTSGVFRVAAIASLLAAIVPIRDRAISTTHHA